jgi:hypothetical protein
LALRDSRISSITNKIVTSGSAVLWTVNVNTGAASGVLKIYNGTSLGGTLIAVIDATSKSSHCYGILCPSGIFIDLTGGAADCTVGYA